jgi:1,4-dihydroxy-2-naphthoate octaprenyltransferase
VLLANNLRDIEPDKKAGKKTLSVRIGKRATQVLFTVIVLVPFAISIFLALFYPPAWLTLLVLLLVLPAVLIVWTYREPKELVVALSLTSLGSLAYAALVFWALHG